MKYQKTDWFEQGVEAASWKPEPLCAGKIAEGLSYEVDQLFQHEPYTYVKISHLREGVTYTAEAYTFCNLSLDTYDPAWGLDRAIIRAKRKIAKRLVWERELPAKLKAALNVQFFADHDVEYFQWALQQVDAQFHGAVVDCN